VVQTRYTRQDKPFVRKAASGGWKAVLPRNRGADRGGLGARDDFAGYPLSSEASKETLVHKGN